MRCWWRSVRVGLLAVLVASACTGRADDSDAPDRSTSFVVDPLLAPCRRASEIPCLAEGAVQVVELAGTNVALVYASDRRADVGSWGGWRLDVQRSLDVGADLLVDADGRRHAVEVVPRRSANVDTLLVAREDAQMVDEFDRSGRLLATRDALTGGSRVALAYNDDGHLEQVDPAAGSTIRLRYDSVGHLEGIDAGRVATDVSTDAEGRIISLLARDGSRWVFGYDDGLLTRASQPTGATTRYAYDDDGALTSMVDPTGRTTSYERQKEGASRTLTGRSSSGAMWSLEQRTSGKKTTSRFQRAGAGTTLEVATASHRRVERVDGSVVELDLTPDPRFGAAAPVRTEERRVLPSGRALVSRASRTAALTDEHDPLAVQRLDAAATGLNERAWSYDGPTRVVTETSALGRVATWTLDEVGRPVATTTPNGPASSTTYDTEGRAAAVERGGATWTQTFDPTAGSTVVDGPSSTSTARFDERGRVVSFGAGDETETTRTFDDAGDPIEIRPGGAGRHILVRDGAGRITATAPPAVPGTPLASTAYERDADGNIVRIVQGDDTAIGIGRGEAGTTDTIDAQGVSIATRRDAAGYLEGIEVAGGPNVEVRRDGDRLLSETWTGPVDGTVSYGYDDEGRVTSIEVGDIETDIVRDRDGGLTGLGPVERKLDDATGRLQTSTIGEVDVTVGYDEHGRTAAVGITGPDGELASRRLDRDDSGRVVAIAEAVGVAQSTTAFGYDSAGRLVSSTADAAPSAVGPDGDLATVTGEPTTIDVAGRLVALGSTTLAYDTGGRVVSITGPEGITDYEWDGLGRLAGVRLPDGRHVTYSIDGDGRRIARDVDGKRTGGWLYAGSLRPIAELDANNTVRTVLLHDDDEHLVGIVRDGAGLTVVSDQLGSPWLVVDADGKIVDHVVRDAGGRVITETAPETTTIGFAGGITDPLTGLVHFGAREYSPRLRRWLSPDPIGFASSEPNLYRYAQGDPVNHVDRTGLDGNIGSTPQPDLTRGDAGRILDQIDKSGGGSNGSSASGTPSIPARAAPPGGPVSRSGGAGSGTVNGAPGRGDSNFESGDYRVPRAPGSGGGTGDVGPGDVSRTESGETPGVPADEGGFDNPFDEGDDFNDDDRNERDDLGNDTARDNDAAENDDAAAGANGDTHLFTLTRRLYDLQLTGEYVAARDSEPGFEVQIRQVPVSGSRTVATVGAVALDVDGSRVVIYARAHDPLLIDGVRTPIDALPVDLAGGGTISHTAGRWRVTWADRSRVDVLGDRRLNVQIRPSPARVARIDGLIGSVDGSLRTSTGATVNTERWPPSFEVVHREFAPTWRITADRSLFTYEPGESTDGFHDPAFPSGPTDLASLDPATVAAARRLCAALSDRGEPAVVAACVLDVAATGDPSFVTDAQLSGVTSPLVGVDPSSTRAGQERPGDSGPEQEVADGETVTGSLDEPGAVARFVVDVPDGLGFALVDTDMSCDLALAVEDDEGLALYGSPLCVGDLDHLRPNPTARLRAGRYHLTVSGDGDATGPFTFRYIAAKPMIFDIEIGDEVTPTPATGIGTLANPGDVHLLRFDAQGARAIEVVGTADDPSTCGDVRIAVYNLATGASVLRAPDPCDHTSRAALPDPNGNYVAIIDSPTWSTGQYAVRLDRTAPG